MIGGIAVKRKVASETTSETANKTNEAMTRGKHRECVGSSIEESISSRH